MKRAFPVVWRYLAVSLLSAGCVCAVPIACPSGGSPTFADLEATNDDGGCFIGDKIFSDFTFASSAQGTTAVAIDQLGYTIVANAPTAIGFVFSGAIGAIGSLSSSSMTITIGWLVTGPDITSNHLSFSPFIFNSATAQVDETYCKGGPVAGCAVADTGQLSVVAGQGIPTQSSDADVFDPVGVLGISKTIFVAAAAGGSFANTGAITQTVDQLAQIPEPATTMVVGCGLVGVWLMRRRRV